MTDDISAVAISLDALLGVIDERSEPCGKRERERARVLFQRDWIKGGSSRRGNWPRPKYSD